MKIRAIEVFLLGEALQWYREWDWHARWRWQRVTWESFVTDLKNHFVPQETLKFQPLKSQPEVWDSVSKNLHKVCQLLDEMMAQNLIYMNKLAELKSSQIASNTGVVETKELEDLGDDQFDTKLSIRTESDLFVKNSKKDDVINHGSDDDSDSNGEVREYAAVKKDNIFGNQELMDDVVMSPGRCLRVQQCSSMMADLVFVTPEVSPVDLHFILRGEILFVESSLCALSNNFSFCIPSVCQNAYESVYFKNASSCGSVEVRRCLCLFEVLYKFLWSRRSFLLPPVKPPDDLVVKLKPYCEPRSVRQLLIGSKWWWYCTECWDLTCSLILGKDSLLWTKTKACASILILEFEVSINICGWDAIFTTQNKSEGLSWLSNVIGSVIMCSDLISKVGECVIRYLEIHVAVIVMRVNYIEMVETFEVWKFDNYYFIRQASAWHLTKKIACHPNQTGDSSTFLYLLIAGYSWPEQEKTFNFILQWDISSLRFIFNMEDMDDKVTVVCQPTDNVSHVSVYARYFINPDKRDKVKPCMTVNLASDLNIFESVTHQGCFMDWVFDLMSATETYIKNLGVSSDVPSMTTCVFLQQSFLGKRLSCLFLWYQHILIFIYLKLMEEGINSKLTLDFKWLARPFIFEEGIIKQNKVELQELWHAQFDYSSRGEPQQQWIIVRYLTSQWLAEDAKLSCASPSIITSQATELKDFLAGHMQPALGCTEKSPHTSSLFIKFRCIHNVYDVESWTPFPICAKFVACNFKNSFGMENASYLKYPNVNSPFILVVEDSVDNYFCKDKSHLQESIGTKRGLRSKYNLRCHYILLVFSLPRPPEVADLEDKVILKDGGMIGAKYEDELVNK